MNNIIKCININLIYNLLSIIFVTRYYFVDTKKKAINIYIQCMTTFVTTF